MSFIENITNELYNQNSNLKKYQYDESNFTICFETDIKIIPIKIKGNYLFITDIISILFDVNEISNDKQKEIIPLYFVKKNKHDYPLDVIKNITKNKLQIYYFKNTSKKEIKKIVKNILQIF
jgi:hypothetical protein